MRALPLIAALAAACTGDGPDDASPASTLPSDEAGWVALLEAPGPYTVGFVETSYTYPDPALGGDRTNALGLWYPTDAAPGGPTVSFLGPASAEGVLDAPDLSADGPFPLHLFSHGFQGDLDNASFVMAWFASHGWIVAAPEHTGNTLSDGTDVTSEIYARRAPDVSAALDHLEADDTFGPSLSGAVLASGHSFGAYTLWGLAGGTFAVDTWAQACQDGSTDRICSTWTADLANTLAAGFTDDRIDAFVSLAGSGWPAYQAEGYAGIDRPVLQLTGALDSSVPDATVSDPIWEALPAPDKIRVALDHGDHQSSMDFAGAGGGLIPGTDPDALPADRSLRLTTVYLGAFAHRYVLSDPAGLDGILDGTTEVDADVTLSTK